MLVKSFNNIFKRRQSHGKLAVGQQRLIDGFISVVLFLTGILHKDQGQKKLIIQMQNRP